jgi:hypothetical protein
VPTNQALRLLAGKSERAWHNWIAPYLIIAKRKSMALAPLAQLKTHDAIKVFSDLARDHTVLNAAVSTTETLLKENPTDKFYR